MTRIVIKDARTGETVERDMTQEEIDSVTPSIETRRAAMVVSRFQAKAALAQAGLLTQAETAVAAADVTAQLAWSDALEFRRTSPTMLALAPALGLDDAALDTLFEQAALIEA